MKSFWTAACGAAILAASGTAALSAPLPPAGDDDAMGGPAPAPAQAGPAAKAAPAAPSGEDVLVLKDGTEVHGRITAEDDAGYAVKVGGALRVVDKGTVKEVRRGAPAPAPGDGTAPGAAPAPGGTPPADGKGDREKRKERRRAAAGQAPDGSAPPAPGSDGAAPGQPPVAQAPPLSDDARAWAKSCIERLMSGDPMVQRSSTEAIRALGPSVLPVLREARDGADEKGKQVLVRVISMVEKGARPGAEGKRPGADGLPAGAKPGQPGQPGPARGPALLERIRTEVGLDDAQTRAVGQALFQFSREAREIGMDARDGLITYEDARTRVTELRGKLREGLKPTLSEEQMKKLDALLDEQGKRMGGGPPAKDGPPPRDPPPPGEKKPADAPK